LDLSRNVKGAEKTNQQQNNPGHPKRQADATVMIEFHTMLPPQAKTRVAPYLAALNYCKRLLLYISNFCLSTHFSGKMIENCKGIPLLRANLVAMQRNIAIFRG
jgi:hypothetical protein